MFVMIHVGSGGLDYLMDADGAGIIPNGPDLAVQRDLVPQPRSGRQE